MKTTLPCRTVILPLCIAVLAALFSSCSRQPRYDAPPISGLEIVVDIPSLPHESPRYYTHVVNNRNVSFFLLKLNKGVFAFFDACVTCYPRKLGYAHQDGRVICRACNMHFSIYKLEKGLGGCYPIRIEGTVIGTNYHIPLSILEQNANKF